MKIYQYIILSSFIIMAIQMLGFVVFLKLNNLSIAGVPPINKTLFKTAKMAMMIVWLSFLIQAIGRLNLSVFEGSYFIKTIAAVLMVIGISIQLISYIYLGKNLKFGIPNNKEKKKAVLKTNGIYQLSRNPMYVGFYLILLAASLYVLNPAVWIFSIFTIIIHHKIILKEELFLKNTFAEQWLNYTIKTRRYL